MPLTRNRWPNRKARKIGIKVTIDIANIAPQLLPSVASRNERSATGTVYLSGVREVDQRDEEVAPGPDEGEDRRGGKRRAHQREHHPAEDPPVPAAVDPSGLVQFAGDAADELDHQEDEEGVGGQELRAGSAA